MTTRFALVAFLAFGLLAPVSSAYAQGPASSDGAISFVPGDQPDSGPIHAVADVDDAPAPPVSKACPVESVPSRPVVKHVTRLTRVTLPTTTRILEKTDPTNGRKIAGLDTRVTRLERSRRSSSHRTHSSAGHPVASKRIAKGGIYVVPPQKNLDGSPVKPGKGDTKMMAFIHGIPDAVWWILGIVVLGLVIRHIMGGAAHARNNSHVPAERHIAVINGIYAGLPTEPTVVAVPKGHQLVPGQKIRTDYESDSNVIRYGRSFGA